MHTETRVGHHLNWSLYTEAEVKLKWFEKFPYKVSV
jgi:hypothetical protein